MTIHSKVLSGKCKVCGHHGEDCTGLECWRMADCAMVAVHAYADKYGYRKNQQYTEDLGTIVSDLIGDLMHYCDREEVSFTAELDRARRHYRTEVWEDDERQKELAK